MNDVTGEQSKDAKLKAFDSDLFELPLPPGHRFPMQKYSRLRERIIASQLAVSLRVPPAASDAQLTLVHAETYVTRVADGTLSDVEQRRIGFPWSAAMVERSRRSTGATVAASYAALQDGVACNLAGGTHHASQDRGQGYCVFNDAAVACACLLAEHCIETALVIDTDVHQGNGTAEIFQSDPRVLTLSIHGEKNFPAKKCSGDIDISLPRGTGDDVYLDALSTGINEAFSRMSPQFIVFTSGADPYVDDTLGSLALSKSGLKQRDEMVLSACFARRIPTVVTMAGGYAEDVGDIVDIHFNTVAEAAKLRRRWAQQEPDGH